eukprot:scaffold43030_cov59-Phaeocystis_antarctica.AAC.5
MACSDKSWKTCSYCRSSSTGSRSSTGRGRQSCAGAVVVRVAHEGRRQGRRDWRPRLGGRGRGRSRWQRSYACDAPVREVGWAVDRGFMRALIRAGRRVVTADQPIIVPDRVQVRVARAVLVYRLPAIDFISRGQV